MLVQDIGATVDFSKAQRIVDYDQVRKNSLWDQ
jgi:hypothetical protein